MSSERARFWGLDKVEVERIAAAHNLGEITEEEYIRNGGPLQARLDTLRGKLKEIEEFFEFLKKILYSTRLELR